MMNMTEDCIYQDAEDVNISFFFKLFTTFIFQYQVLVMPYVDSEVFMFVILPRERFGLLWVLKNLTGSKLLELLNIQNRKEVRIHVSFNQYNTIPL
jgi:serine protease inhibitor